jgi:hypothetical protein
MAGIIFLLLAAIILFAAVAYRLLSAPGIVGADVTETVHRNARLLKSLQRRGRRRGRRDDQVKSIQR